MKTLPNLSNLSAVQTRKYTTNMASKILRRASYKAETAPRKNLAIVDSKVENYQELLGGVKRGTEVILLDRFRDGIEQITEILGQRSSITSLHIVSHGREAAVEIGSTELNIDNLETYSNQLQQWGKALNESASILLYGCNVAAGESGIKFIQKLSELTGANIAASNNLTGSAALGGDWKLEITTGQINTEIAFEKKVLEGYTSVLATLAAEEFKNSTVIGPWIYGTGNASTPDPGLTAGAANPNGVIPALGTGDPPGTGTLRLTSNVKAQSAFVIYNNPISATEGLRITFDFFSYNISADSSARADPNNTNNTIGPPVGADGTSFFLIDGTATPTKAGGYGGSLGYAQNTNSNSPGIVGGYLGVGLDEFGFFSTTSGGKVGGSPNPFFNYKEDSVALRGSETNLYNFLSGAVVPGGIDNRTDNTKTTIRSEAKRRVQVTLFPANSATPNRLTVGFDLNNNGSFDDVGETLIDIPNLEALNGAVPRTFKFGFAASTGNSTNIHEVNNVIIQSINPPTLQADVSIVKKGPLYATPNSTITYTITSTNNGPNTAESVLIQDPLPEGLSFVGASDGGTFNPKTRTVIWPAILTLANGASEIRTITATVPGTLGTALTNTAYSTSSTFDPNLANNNSSQPISQVTTTVAAIADLVTTKTKTGTTAAAPGEKLTYTISTVNNGPSTADNVTITDSIIPGLTGVVVSNGTYDSNTGIVTFGPATSLASGVTVNNTVSFTAPPSGSVSNTARSTSPTVDPTPGNNEVTVTTPLFPSADLVTTKTKTGTTAAAPGEKLTYTISTVNNGPSTADNVTITDSIIPNLTGVVVSNGTYDSNTGIVTFGPATSLASGVTVINTVSFIAPPSGSVSNTARSTSPTVDPTPGNNEVTVTTPLFPSADLVTTKTKTGTTAAAPGEKLTYTISTVNNGPSTADNVTITDSIIPNLTGVIPSNGGVYDAATGIVTFGPATSLASGATVINTVSFIAPPSGSVSNTARSTSPTADPTPGNNEVTVTTPLTPSADLVTTKTGTTKAAPGETLTYTISTVNNGPSTAENVTVTDSIIPGLTGVIPSNGGVYDTNTGIVTFGPATSLASGATVINTVSFIAPPSGSVSNTARSTSPTADPTPGNNEVTVTTPLTPTPTSNQPPVANNANSSLGPNSSQLVTGLGGSDPDGSIVSYTINTLPPADQAVLFLGDPANGGVAVTPGQVLTPAQLQQLFFQATGNFTGANFTYSATDNSGATSPAVATVAAILPTSNQPPIANNANSSLGPNSSQLVTGLGGSDPDGSIASYTINTLPPADQAVLFLGDPANGGVAVTPGQVLTPAQLQQLFFFTTGNFTGANFTYSATDNSGATSPAAATVAAILPTSNQPPIANNANSSLGPNSSRLVTGLGGSDPDGSIASYTINTLPPADQAVLFLGDPANGGVAVTPGQVLTPAQLQQLFFLTTGNFTGTNFTYSATDNRGAISPAATATLAGLIAPTPAPTPTTIPAPTPAPTPTTIPTIPILNQPPVANNANSSLGPNSSKLVTGLGGSDPDGSIASYTINTLPPADQAVLFLGDPANGGQAVTPGQVLTPAQLQQLFFLTTGNFTGANFTYSATDNRGAISPAATATVAGLPPAPNQPPVATNASFSVPPKTTLVRGLGGTDPDGTIVSFTITSLPPSNQGVLFLGDPANAGVPVTLGQVLTPAESGQLFFQATDNFTGATFTYISTDNSGATSLATATVAGVLVATPTPTPTTGPIPNPVAEPDIDCGCETQVGKPGINFLLPTQPPSVSFKRPISQLGDGQTVRGTDDSDFIQDRNGNQKIIGFKGSDLLLGEDGADEIYGDEENDTIFGNISTDIVYGGNQNDLIFAGKDNDWIAGELGSDTLLGDRGADTILGDTGQNNSESPDDARDLIFGGEGTDAINGNEGDDTIHAGKGNDIALGGKNNDLIWGELGSDTLFGGNEDDSLFGGKRDNSVSDAQGRDLLYGGFGNDLLNGQENDDTLIAGKYDDRAYGGKGNDLVFGQLGSDTLYGGQGIDTILGDSGSSNPVGDGVEQDLIFGGAAGDIIGGGNGDDTVQAGKGNDFVWGGKDNDLIFGERGNDTLTGDSGNDTLYGGVPGFLREDADGKDWLFGNRGSDLLFGMESDDTLIGGKAKDDIYGGKGNDLIHGDKGDDLIYGGDGSDEICGDEGNDTIFGDRSDNRGFSVGANDQQDCVNGGDGDDLLYGNEGQDTINGDVGSDTLIGGKDSDLLNGGAGDDWLFGDLGDDTLSGGIGSDRFVLSADGGTDTVINFEVGVDKFVLTGGLSFQQLQLSPTPNGTLLQVAGTDRVLGNLIGVNGAIGSSDFLSNLLRSEG
ncbi:DUF4347 domain-containing protein [Microcoleus sp. SVA1_B3]|uniref:DUF4347 domain-containing protein n=1 Tax=Microcoleus sp. SVA1_B3 TaxID=2818950 RepID=UPI002FCF304C